MDNKDYILETPIKLSIDGNLEDTYSLTLVSPVKKFIRKTYKLQQMFMQAQIQQADLLSGIIENRKKDTEEKEESEDVELKSSDIMQMLLSSNVDIESMIDEFERLALLGAVTINDKKLNPIQWNDVDDSDKEALMTNYVAFFISTLAMKSFSKI